MFKIALLQFTVLVSITTTPAHAQSHVGACYYGDWAAGRPYPAGISASQLDPNICTHIIVSFLKVADNNELTYYSGGQMSGLNSAVKLRLKNPQLKVMVAVGGWNHGPTPFYKMSSAVGGPEKFADSAVALLKRHDLDGLDIDWEYPHAHHTAGKEGFSKVVKALRKAFDAVSGRKLLLSAAVTGNIHYAPLSYDYSVLGSALDYVFIMSYDFHGQWGSKTGHQSALTGDQWDYDVSSAARHYFNKGVPQHKIILGFPTYGRAFGLTSSSTGVGAPSGWGVAGRYTRENGFLAYYEICGNYLARGASYHWDASAKASYMVQGKVWVSFDSKQAYCHKLRWLKNNGFGGWMVWAIDLDDHANMCSEGRYPLMSYLKANTGKVLTEAECDSPALKPNPKQVTGITTVIPGSTQPGPTHGPNPDDTFCENKADGLNVDVLDCTRFIHCHGGVTYVKQCQDGLRYNGAAKACDWPQNVDCSQTATQPTPATTTTGQPKPTTTPNLPQTTPDLVDKTTTAKGERFDKNFCQPKSNGYYQNVADECKSFYQCHSGITYTFLCQPGLLFNSVISNCDWPQNVQCPG